MRSLSCSFLENKFSHFLWASYSSRLAATLCGIVVEAERRAKELVCSPCERRNLVMQREEKGRDIATHRLIERKGKCWEVPSQSGKGKYTVDLEKPSCTCPDFALRGLKCKHIYAVEYTLTPPNEALSMVGKTKRPTYRQDWSAYHAAQTHEKAHFQALLHDLCQGIKEPVQSRGRRSLSWKDLVWSSGVQNLFNALHQTFYERTGPSLGLWVH